MNTNTHVLKIHVAKPFGNLYRTDTVLVVVRVGNKYIFGGKAGYYPEGITRLLGGGVNGGETLEFAAQREIEEELSVKITKEQLKKIDDVIVEADDDLGKKYKMKISMFFVDLSNIRSFIAGDDVTNLIYLTKEEFKKLVENFNKLPQDLWRNQDGEEFSWADYGKLYGFVHDVALNSVEKLGL